MANEIKLDTKEYDFLVDGTLPMLHFRITRGKEMSKAGRTGKEEQLLTIEIFNPQSKEIFEASYDQSRIEVDQDGSVTYFVRKRDKISFSLFLGKSIVVELNSKDDTFEVKTPSKMKNVKVEENEISGVSYSLFRCELD